MQVLTRPGPDQRADPRSESLTGGSLRLEPATNAAVRCFLSDVFLLRHQDLRLAVKSTSPLIP